MKSFTTAIAATLAIVGMAQAHAAQVYRGLFAERDTRVLMTLELEPSAKPGEQAGRLRIAEPWSCQLRLRAMEGEGQGRRYSLDYANGGRCDRLMQGSLKVQIDGDNAAVRVFDPKGSQVYAADLIEVRP